VQAYDGFDWSAWQPFLVSAPVNHAPTVTAPNQNIAHGANVAASSLFVVSDADGDAPTRYHFYDDTIGGGALYRCGVVQGERQAIDVTAAQLSQTTFTGSGTDQLFVQASDGFGWSGWTPFTVTAPVNHAPIVTAPSQSIAHGVDVAASSLFATSDADG